MEIMSSREFRSNQTAVLNRALRGEKVFLRTRMGMFRLMPVREHKDLTARICEGLKEVKLMHEGKLPKRSAREFLDEL